MKKQEFLKTWTKFRERALREGYKNDPHGAACLAMSLCDLPKDGERLWRKYRSVLANTPISAFEVSLRKESADAL